MLSNLRQHKPGEAHNERLSTEPRTAGPGGDAMLRRRSFHDWMRGGCGYRDRETTAGRFPNATRAAAACACVLARPAQAVSLLETSNS
jgi:hypothetical protein